MNTETKNKIAAYSNINTFLQFSRGESRARDTYGYPIVRLCENNTGRTYKCTGGGYDMHGTNLGSYIKNLVNEESAALEALATYVYNLIHSEGNLPYGLSLRKSELCKNKEGKLIASKVRKEILQQQFYLDGACGESCMKKIAQGMGLIFKDEYSRSRRKGVTDKFLGVSVSLNPEGFLVKYLYKKAS